MLCLYYNVFFFPKGIFWTFHIIDNFLVAIWLVFISLPVSLQCHHLPQHRYQFLSHHRPLKLEERLKVQEAQAITYREKEVLTGVKQRYAVSVILHLQSFRELPRFVHLNIFFSSRWAYWTTTVYWFTC